MLAGWTQALVDDPDVSIVWSEIDWGPATKLIPVLDIERDPRTMVRQSLIHSQPISHVVPPLLSKIRFIYARSTISCT
jgi:hypothetical protein